MRLLAVALIVLTLAGVGLSRQLRTPSPANVVIITLDTTRADRLTPYGFADISMPGLERLAREGVVFDQAITVAPLTLPAHTSLLTGLLPTHHGVRDNADEGLAAEATTLAEILRTKGYCTAAFVSSVVLDANRGLAQGFDVYGDVPTVASDMRASQLRAETVVDHAIAWLDGGQQCPRFIWTHLYDAHRPYEPPEPFRSRHADPYLGEIAYAESQVTRLLDALDRRRLLDDTLVVVVADHGESLGEHGEENHGIFLYESVVRIPLFIRLPTRLQAPRTAGVRVSDVVRLIDVMPTVLDVAGVRGPDGDGVSLLPAMNGERQDLEAVAESMYPLRFGSSPLRMVRDQRYKLIDGARPEMYDLAIDPFEDRNIYSERAALAAVMGRRLAVLDGRTARSSGALAEPSRELRERLEALGYTAGGRHRAPFRNSEESRQDKR